jgi:hypothetical protein
MSEFGRSFPLDEQQSINNILNNAEESLASADLANVKLVMVKVEETASRITAAMLTAV